ncbi:formimidoylglutamate deiminase, partial [Acinetobacter baumannii]|nr:formimidoylglutamate deiminase [Acinetobacter baumannii]
MSAVFARHALLPEGWRRDVLLEWDEHGDLVLVAPDVPAPVNTARAGYVLP